MLCIIWGYFWFAEFMLIWYANIPEETAYFIPRVKGRGLEILFLCQYCHQLVPSLCFTDAQGHRLRINWL